MLPFDVEVLMISADTPSNRNSSPGVLSGGYHVGVSTFLSTPSA